MNFKLSNIYITKPLNEAHEPNKYAIPEDVLNGTVQDDEKEKAEQELDAANQPQEEIPEEPQNEEQPQEQMDEQQPPVEGEELPPEEAPVDNAAPADGSNVTQQEVNPDKDENGNDPTSVINDIENPDDPDNQEFGDPNDQAFDQEQMDGQSDDMSMDDLNSEAEATPGLHILSSVTDNQYRLMNSELYSKFSALITKVNETIEIDVNSLSPNSERLIQCKKIVSDNLHGMIHDLENFMLYTFSDTYESNVITYMKFMKRFQCALTIIDRIKNNKNH